MKGLERSIETDPFTLMKSLSEKSSSLKLNFAKIFEIGLSTKLNSEKFAHFDPFNNKIKFSENLLWEKFLPLR